MVTASPSGECRATVAIEWENIQLALADRCAMYGGPRQPSGTGRPAVHGAPRARARPRRSALRQDDREGWGSGVGKSSRAHAIPCLEADHPPPAIGQSGDPRGARGRVKRFLLPSLLGDRRRRHAVVAGMMVRPASGGYEQVGRRTRTFINER